MEFKQQLDGYVRIVEDALPGYLPGEDCPQKSVVQAMAYALTGGGKRIRAVLLLAFYRLFCGEREEVDGALPFSAALEMIHAYSLIHDDLPCMDDDNMRRGKPSCHIAFGEAIALLAGDGLLTLAFETASGEKVANEFSADKIVRIVRCLAHAAGYAGMIGGQVIDLESEGHPVSLDTLRLMDERKTGALIAVAAEIGCILGGATAAETACALEYAHNLGIAFQIVDDILDQTGNQQLLGKPIGSDRENGKSTYTSLYGVEGAKKIAREMNTQAKDALRRTGRDTLFLEQLADYLLEREF